MFEMLCLATMDDSRLPKKKKIKWSLVLANKGKSSWCFHVKKLLNSHIDLGHLNPENVTCLSAKEFQTISIAKLHTRLTVNGKCESLSNPNAYSSDSGGTLHNFRVIKQTPSLKSYLCRYYYHLQRTLLVAL